MSARPGLTGLAVIGGGIAGSACALAAARLGLTVALFEPQPGPIDKPCGEGCLASGVRVLEEFGLGALVERGAPLLDATYVIPGGPRLSVPFPRPGRGFDRRVLAAALDELVARESRITRIPSTARVERVERGFVVHGASVALEARAVAACDGLGGHAAAWLRDPRPVDAERIGLRGRCRLRPSAPEPRGVTILMRDRRGQIYLTPLPERRLNVSLLLDGPPGPGGAARWFEQALTEPELAAIVESVETAPELRSLARRRPQALAADGAFLVGDAAGGVDPVIGCGVSVALATGLAAARGARELADGRPARDVSADYARVARAETVRRNRAAALVLALSRRPTLARAALRLFSRAPSLSAALARAAAGETAASNR